MKTDGIIHLDLLLAENIVYKPSGLICNKILQEAESQEYGACTFEINSKIVKFRVGKITPTKIGHFVTLWKRVGNGPILPYDLADQIDLFVVSVRNGNYFGQFIFPKIILFEKGYISKEGKGGKRAMRVYPPWDRVDNQQAKNTQAWQLIYFFEINLNKPINIIEIQKLFS